MNCIQAWKVLSVNQFVTILATVRNKILNFVLEIESEEPNAGEALNNLNPVPKEKVHQIFNTYISGNVQNVATGSSDFTQTSTVGLKGNLSELLSIMQKNNMPKKDIDELKVAIEQDNSNDPNKNGLGNNVTGWFGKMIQKASNGAWKVGTSTATTLITKALSSYYGLD
jgi:AbiTii